MIRFDILDNGKSIPVGLDFMYSFDKDGRRVTTAKLYLNNVEMRTVTCAQDSRDRDVKQIARKNAMKKLLRNENRFIRTQIWHNYHVRT